MSEEGWDGEGETLQPISLPSCTLGYVSLVGLVTWCGPMYLCACVIEERGENPGGRGTLRSEVLS